MKILLRFGVFVLMAITLIGFLTATCFRFRDQSSSTNYEGWIRVDKKEFSFSIPKEMIELEAQGTDTVVYRFSSNHLKVNIQYGPFISGFTEVSKSVQNHRNYSEEAINLSGESAVMYSYEAADKKDSADSEIVTQVIGVHFESVLHGTNKAVFVVKGDSEDIQDVAKRIFRSITFHN